MIFGLFLTGLALIATLGCVLAPRIWLMDLVVHFRLQYAAVALAGGIILAVSAQPWLAALACVIAAANVLTATPLMFSSRSEPAAGHAPSPAVRIASINVFYRNRQHRRVVDFIARERPDAVVLVEINSEWERALDAVDAEYAYRYTARGKRGKGITLLSRWPLIAAGMLPGYSDVQSALAATLEIHGRRIELLGIHTTWPMGRRRSGLRNQQLRFLGEFAGARKEPLVIVGDLNVSPFSAHFQGLLATGHLKSAAQGRGWQPTWPTFMPLAGIQIDHALTNAAVAVTSFRRGSPVGSDHRPIVIEFFV